MLAQPPPLPAWLPLPRPRTARRRIALAACFGILLLLCGDASFAADGKTLFSGGGDWGKPGTVRQWETKAWKAGATLAHPTEVLCVAASPDGRWLAVAGTAPAVRVWDLRSAK